MARSRKSKDEDDFERVYGVDTGNALKDGYTTLLVSPWTAAPGNFMPEDEAREYDETTDMMMEFGGRETRLRRNRDIT